MVHWEERGSAELAKKIGCSSAPLDAVTRHVRQRETNAGDFVADAVKNMHRTSRKALLAWTCPACRYLRRGRKLVVASRTQVALINGGTIRGDKVAGPNELSWRNAVNVVRDVSAPISPQPRQGLRSWRSFERDRHRVASVWEPRQHFEEVL